MKNISIFISFIFSTANIFAQKEIFDIATYTAPAAWKKAKTENAIQLTKEDVAKGTYCAITLFKSLPATPNAKENFDLAWTSVVKEMVTVATPPEMQSSEIENGWETHSGYAPFENESSKGVVILVTSTGYNKMMNLIILTNTDVYEKEMTAFIESIYLKKPLAEKSNITITKKNAEPQKNITGPVTTNGFAFTTTNFDDGWNSTVKEDWVEVTKANIKVLIHYPNKKADAYNSVLMDGLKNGWNVLVAPRYSSASNMEFKPLSGWQSIEFAEADMVEKNTNKSVHVVLFKMNYSNGNGKYLEFITADKNSFEKEFVAYQQKTYGWEKLEKMANYNKFAVAASDLTGKWTNDFSGAIQYVSASTGFDSHMSTHASVENFLITAANTYNWDLGVASGNVGNIKFQSVKSNGKLSMTGNWKLNFSDIGGKPRTYNVYFSCIKGLRILWLDERAFAKAD